MSPITKEEITDIVASWRAGMRRGKVLADSGLSVLATDTIRVLEHVARDMDRRAHLGRERQPNERSLEASAWEIFVAQVASGCNGIGDHLYPGVQKDLARNAFVLALAFREVAAETRKVNS